MDSAHSPFRTVRRYQKLWKSYVKLRHLLANSPKVKQIDKQKLMQREVGGCVCQHGDDGVGVVSQAERQRCSKVNVLRSHAVFDARGPA